MPLFGMLLVLGLSSGCSFDDTAGDGPDPDTGIDVQVDTGSSDADTIEEDVADTETDIGEDVMPDTTSDTGGDVMPDTTSDTGGDVMGDAGPGAYMDSCSTDADCDSGYCIDTESGGVCSKACSADADCGSEWVCDELVDDASTSICFPPANQLCTTDCTSDADCGEFGSLCVTTGNRSVCSRSCVTRACDDGFSCEDVTSADGTNGSQCTPDSGSCGDCTDSDGDGFGVGADCSQTDCDDTDATVYPGASEQCNGSDDSCDNVVDEGCDCFFDSEMQGVCATATIDANGDCAQPAGYEMDESSCGDSLDNDCDGVEDEGCPCEYNSVSDGVCGGATRDASGDCQMPSSFVSDEGASDCDGADNDCDGQVDEGCTCSDGDTQDCYNADPATIGEGLCTQGTQTCSGGVWGACQNEVTPTTETCGNSTDEDCDGQVDEGCCTGLDSASVVSSTSACLTSGSSAEAAIVVELVDTAGDPVTGSTVTMTSSEGSLGSVTSNGNVYHAILSPPAASGVTGTTIDVEATDACSGSSVTLASVNVVFSDPISGTAGGAGGCQADGNVRVKVVRAEDGTAIQGANVMVGAQENSSALETSYGQGASDPNTGVTDAQGIVEFKDFQAVLDSPVTVTAASTDRAYKTMVGADAADFILPLEQINPVVDEGTYSGKFTSIDSGGDVDAGLMLADVSVDDLLSFNLNKLLADDGCYSAGFLGDFPLPMNTYLPEQRVLITLPEKEYTSAPIEYGNRKLVGLAGETTSNAATSGDFTQILQQLELQKIGVRDENVSSATNPGTDLDMTDPLNPNITCDHSNFPQDADLFCITGGDWDSLNDPNLPLGAGRLFVMGLGVQGTAGSGSTQSTINDVTTVEDANDFAGIEYFGASAALYLDAGNAPSNDVASGASIIANRGANQFDSASPATLTFDNYIPIRTLTRSQRNFAASALGGGSYPTPHYTRTLFQHQITEQYDVCGQNDGDRVISETYWTVYAPGSTDDWDLPIPPAGWPRQSGGVYSGLVDPTSTSVDDDMVWLHSTIHEAPNASSFDYASMRFDSLVESVSHVSLNSSAL